MNYLIYLSFIFIGAYSIKNLFFIDKRVYTINKLIWVYVLVFWSVIPFIQYYAGQFSWGINVSIYDALKANLLVALWVIVYWYYYRKFSDKNWKKPVDKLPIQPFKIKSIGIIIILILQFSIFLYYYYKGGGIVMLRGQSIAPIGQSKAEFLVIDRLLRSFTALSTIILCMNFKFNSEKTRGFHVIYGGVFLISITFLLLTNFPLATARYMAAAFYIGLIFVMKPYFKVRSLPYLVLIGLILVVYPAISYVRYLVSLSTFELNLLNPYYFYTADFDNYSTLIMTIQHVEKAGITFGRQLLGVLFFFVPRSIWPDKPIGSGAFIAEERLWDFTNISCPFVAEGYINFGIIGVIIFAIMLAYVVALFDTKFYKYGRLSKSKIFYPLMLGLILFILRGDLMSSFAFSVGFGISAILLYFLVKPFVIYKSN